jgi:hypothetical protein
MEIGDGSTLSRLRADLGFYREELTPDNLDPLSLLIDAPTVRSPFSAKVNSTKTYLRCLPITTPISLRLRKSSAPC